MPHQGIPLSQFFSCPICQEHFDEKEHKPISLPCDHVVCKPCILSNLEERKCPFDSSSFPADIENLPTNYALIRLMGSTVPEHERESPPSSADKPRSYIQTQQCIEDMAIHLKPIAENPSDDESNPKTPSHHARSFMSEKSTSKCVLSRPIQRKLISLIQCQLLEEEGRSRSARIARSIGERIVTELLSLQQYPQQLSANLWAAIRTRGCQFLGPAMQEEVLKLILLALEDGSSLSRKVLVLFVVQKLESHYPQASKTAIGHVVQLLYRASCFKVMKRDEASSLMQLKDEFRQYDALRREHDAQIVQIALEAGLRIPPEYWSSLLYGDSSYKSHMQSIIDKHQNSQSFMQCIEELMHTLQRNGDPCGLLRIQPQLEFLSSVDPSPLCPAPSWENLEAVMRSLNTVMKSFIGFLSGPGYRMRLESMSVPNTRYKTSMCRDYLAKGMCPRGGSCTFAHSQDELERHRVRSRRSGRKVENGETPDGLPLTDGQYFSRLDLASDPPSPGALSDTEEDDIQSSFVMPADALSSFGLSNRPQGTTGMTPSFLELPHRQGARSGSVNANGNAYGSGGYQPSATTSLPSPYEFAPSMSVPATKLTFSEPAKEAAEMPSYLPMGSQQTSTHPHNPSYAVGHSVVNRHPHHHPFVPPPGMNPGLHHQPNPHPNPNPPPHPHHPHHPQAWLDTGGHHVAGLRHPVVPPGYTPSLDAQAVQRAPSPAAAAAAVMMPYPPGYPPGHPAGTHQQPPSQAPLGPPPPAAAVHALDRYRPCHPGMGAVDYVGQGPGGVIVYPCVGCQQQQPPNAAVSSLAFHSHHHPSSSSSEEPTALLLGPQSSVLPPTAVQPLSTAPQVIDGRASQNISLEDLTSRKREIIHDLQEEPTFLDPTTQVYGADRAKGGFDGLRTVLGHNRMRERETMSKLVSDTFVAARSTRSLDIFMYEDLPLYKTQWSSGVDVEHPPRNKVASCVTSDSGGDSSSIFFPEVQEAYQERPPPPSSLSSSLADTRRTQMPAASSNEQCAQGSLYNSLGSNIDNCDRPYTHTESNQAKTLTTDAEFSRFPTDGDETIIPFEHTSVSRFGPISRMARAKTNNVAPVQVTADSSKRLTSVLAVPLQERPTPLTAPGASRYGGSADRFMAEPSVRPTPTEAPSIWQESPQPSFMNIALLKAGAAGAISNNERLAYELQAVELEISLKTGKVPEPVGKIIQEAVMGTLPSTIDSCYHGDQGDQAKALYATSTGLGYLGHGQGRSFTS